jgi:hypothetical protein
VPEKWYWLTLIFPSVLLHPEFKIGIHDSVKCDCEHRHNDKPEGKPAGKDPKAGNYTGEFE